MRSLVRGVGGEAIACRWVRLGFGLVLLLMVGGAWGQEPVYSRLNSLDLFGEYSNTSSHLILGVSRDRKLGTFGVGYSRRILLRRGVDLQYRAEVRPMVFESDPVVRLTETVATTTAFPGGAMTFTASLGTTREAGRCVTGTQGTYVFTNPSGVVEETDVVSGVCGRIWTYGEGLSPAGLKLNLRPRSRVQPVFSLLGGYLFSTQPIPVGDAGSFNFTFEFGGGVEVYRKGGAAEGWLGDRSVRVEYRIHHISNKNSAVANPGIDNGVVQVTFGFGR